MNRHVQWLARTILVNRSHAVPDPEATFRKLEKNLSIEGHHADWKRNRYFEKRWMKRRRLAYEECKGIYNQEMRRKIAFVLKGKHRNPWRIE